MSFSAAFLAILSEVAAFCVLVYFSDAPFGVTTLCVVVIVFCERFVSDA